MGGWVLGVLVVLALVVLLAVFGRLASGGAIGFPYSRIKTLFSPAERAFLIALDQAVGPEHRVFGKVRLADLAQVRSGLSKSARQGALNRIASKHVDFVVCRKVDLSVVCAVELNDRSHQSTRGVRRDALVAGVFEAIEVPLVAIPAAKGYDVEALRAKLGTVLVPSPPLSLTSGRPDRIEPA